jgi:DUF2075 family protein
MLVYSNTVKGFLADVNDNLIDLKVRDRMQERLQMRVSESEFASWGSSLQYVANPLRDSRIPDDAGVSIECQLPLSSKRIDFMLSGYDHRGTPQVVIIELKQWSEVAVTEQDGLVRTYLGGGERATAHPSYQAWSYAEYLNNFNETVAQEGIQLQPCAFVHNCTDDKALRDVRYAPYTQQAPVFLRRDVPALRGYLEESVHAGDRGVLMERIDHGRIRPSKSLADSLVGMLKRQREFILLDEQKVAFELALSAMRRCKADSSAPKQVVVVRGGPGTGKSVVAINLLVRALAEGCNAAYVTKNAAPRDVYREKLTGTGGALARARYGALFKGSGAFLDCAADEFDMLIVDEAHRLNEKSGLYSNLGENQIKEIIAACRASVFFIDEDQRIHIQDIGSEAEIRRWAADAGAEVIDADLPSQFRCNGEDGYLAFVDHFLGIRETAHPTLAGVDYEFKTFGTPGELDRWVREKNTISGKARTVAGYCWDWKSKQHAAAFDFDYPDFQRQWNLSEDGNLWILKPESINQIGCIHTCQGLECDYIGVLIGPDLLRDAATGTVTTHPEARSRQDRSVFGWKKRLVENPTATRKLLDALIKNTYRTLMTRGMKGCAVCFVDR